MTIIESLEAGTVDMLQAAAGPGDAFDYSQMDATAAHEAKAAVERYRERQKAYVLDTGRDLLAVKARLEHGLFLKWVQAEMGMNARTAQRAMNAAEALGDKSDTVSYLPPTVLYELAAPSTPGPVREAVLRRIEAGEAVKADAILDEVRAAKEAARVLATAEREKARRAALSEEDRAEEDARNRRRAKTAEAKEADRLREREEAKAARGRQRALDKEAAEIFVATFGADAALAFVAKYEGANLFGIAEELALLQISIPVVPDDIKTSEIWVTPWHRQWARDTILDPYGIAREEGLDALAEQMQRDGQLKPIILTPNTSSDPDDRRRGKYRLVDGKKRLSVASRLGWDTILAKVVVPFGQADGKAAEAHRV